VKERVLPSNLPAPVETPLLRHGGAWIKAEGAQLSGSAKYRMVHAKLAEAFRRGDMAPGTTLMEVTSGSTGVALAWAGRRLGLPVELHAYRSIREEKREAIERLGARLVLHPPERPVAELLDLVARRVREGGAWHLGQYDRASVGRAYAALAAEIVGQVVAENASTPRAFVCPVGTGGLLQGVGAWLRDAWPGLRVVALEPKEDVAIDGVRDTRRFHLGAADPYDLAFPDETARVAAPAARVRIGELLLGESASAAVELARSRNESDVLLIAPD
jgi:cysteine synthase